jgi:hypothetical protein
MDLYVFSSRTVTNVWAALGARMWAISKAAASSKGPRARAARFPIGSIGVLYVSGKKNEFLTTPFVVCTRPQPSQEVGDVWPESWACPFQIHPLGTPRRRLPIREAIDLLPVLRGHGQDWHHVLRVGPVEVFSPAVITAEDWGLLLDRLAGP